MSRRAILGIVAAILVVIGIPVAVVALAGDDDGGAGGEVANGRTVFEDGINTENAPEEQLDPQTKPGGDDENGRGEGAKKPGGPPRAYPASQNVAYPNDVTDSGGDVARTVERHMGSIQGKADQLTVIGADCRDGACSARYVSGPHGGGIIIRDAAVILRRLFRQASIRSVKLFIHEPHGKRTDTVEPMALAVITCRRTDHPGFAWDELTARQLPRRCSLAEQSPGKLGSQIRRGKLSEKDASRGNAGSGGGHAGASGDTAPPGAKPSGTPRPRNVNPKGEPPARARRRG